MRPRLMLATALALVLSAPAFAQDATVTLQIDSGTAMISTGGEFTTAASGTQVPAGARVMVPEGSRATLVYSNGCSRSLGSTGVHGVPATCVAGGSNTAGSGGAGGTGSALGTVGVVALGTALVAGGLASMDDVPVDESALSR